MRTRRVTELAFAVGATAVVLLLASDRQALHAAEPTAPVRWAGLVGGGPRPTVSVGQRMIVVLKSPSLAERVVAHGGVASTKQEQAWTSSLLAQQRLLRSRLEVQGVAIHPEFSFTHVLSGFSAALDASSVSLLERDSAVQGIYPVRVAYPASVTSDVLEQRSLASAVGNADLSLPGYDGRGVTIALLDTGVDRLHPSLVGSVSRGVDIVDPSGDATAQAPPGRPGDVERHGTELAGILVGDRGPEVSHGIARGANVLPIRVAGWQTDGRGGYAVYSRTDQLIEGLERAVDPNDDGDAHDAARVALVGVAAPYAGFADDPAARAVAGAVGLDTLVVAPAGNDGPAGPGFGSISGPGGSPAALTVGAADMRAHIQHVRVSLRSGLSPVLDRMLPLTGELAPRDAFTTEAAAPGLVRRRADFSRLDSYFTEDGLSLVAGRAAVVPGRQLSRCDRPQRGAGRCDGRSPVRGTASRGRRAARRGHTRARRLDSVRGRRQAALGNRPRPGRGRVDRDGTRRRERRCDLRRDVLVDGARVRRSCETGRRLVRRRHRYGGADGRERVLDEIRNRQRIERRCRRRRRCCARCSQRRGPHSARRIYAACSSEVRAGCREPR